MRHHRHVILACFGTDGDVYPFLGIGNALRERGHDVTLATQEHFADRAADAGLDFSPLISRGELDEMLARKEFWDPIRGPIVVARSWRRFIGDQFETLAKLASRKNAVLVTHPGIVAARILHERSDVPLISVLLQPWMIPSIHDPPAMMGGWTLPRWAPAIAGRLYYRMVDAVGDLLVGQEVNRLRAGLGMKRVRRIFQWWHSPHLVLGMFPDWFGEPQPDWPSQIKLVGFPLDDGRAKTNIPRATIEFCRAGAAPVAFTFGTGMLHSAKVFKDCVEACRRVASRGVLITRHVSQLPGALPDFMHHCEFAPFQDLFPLCATVVHHGGIGTASKALAAGVPQLILPFAFDQLDNALRVRRLGAGDFLKASQRNPRTIAAMLRALWRTKQSAQAMAKRLNTRSGLQCAADEIETFTIARSRIGSATSGRGVGAASP